MVSATETGNIYQQPADPAGITELDDTIVYMPKQREQAQRVQVREALAGALLRHRWSGITGAIAISGEVIYPSHLRGA